jgi:hypothetical protein
MPHATSVVHPAVSCRLLAHVRCSRHGADGFATQPIDPALLIEIEADAIVP